MELSEGIVMAKTPSAVMLETGTDKVTVHAYGPMYDDHFRTRPPKTILEIGVYKGASLRAWSQLAETVYGFDTKPVPPDLPANCHISRGDAADPVSVNRAMNAWGMIPGSLDLVIDDGSHHFKDQLASYMLLWNYVADGGTYIIEDYDPTNPVEPFVRLGAVVHDLRSVKGYYNDILLVFQK